MNTTPPLERAAELEPLGCAICEALSNEVKKLGLDDLVTLPGWKQAVFELQRDPASGEQTLAALWKNGRGHQLGCILIHADGSFFAEHDVVRPHPGKPRWFVEAVTAWGRDGVIKTEPRLLPMPE